MTREVYAGIFVLLLFVWPIGFLSDHLLAGACLLVGNALIICAVFYYNSYKDLTFWEGLCVVTGSWMSGCMNLTIIYIFPALFLFFLICLGNALWALFSNRESAQNRWVNIVVRAKGR